MPKANIIESEFFLTPDVTGFEVKRSFAQRKDLLCIALVDNGVPVGLINRSDFYLRYAEDFGPSLYNRRAATLLADLSPLIFDINDPISVLLDASDEYTTAQLTKGLIVTRDGRYAGVSSLLTLLRATRAEADHLQFLVEELEAAHERALAADAAKTRFLATMTHELRTPLNAILGYAELIMEEADDVARKDAGKIASAGKHLLGLINEVLDFTKLDAHQETLAPTWFNADTWAQEVVDLIAPLARTNENKLVLHVSPGMPAIFNDEARLRQCLFNIAGNACKFTKNGLVTISVFCRDDALRVKVSDTGIGMNAEQLARVFNPFSQADASVSRKFGGTGLGLSITKKLVELMQGGVIVESSVGMGSTFEFFVPLHLKSEQDSPAPASVAA